MLLGFSLLEACCPVLRLRYFIPPRVSNLIGDGCALDSFQSNHIYAFVMRDGPRITVKLPVVAITMTIENEILLTFDMASITTKFLLDIHDHHRAILGTAVEYDQLDRGLRV